MEPYHNVFEAESSNRYDAKPTGESDTINFLERGSVPGVQQTVLYVESVNDLLKSTNNTPDPLSANENSAYETGDHWHDKKQSVNHENYSTTTSEKEFEEQQYSRQLDMDGSLNTLFQQGVSQHPPMGSNVIHNTLIHQNINQQYPPKQPPVDSHPHPPNFPYNPHSTSYSMGLDNRILGAEHNSIYGNTYQPPNPIEGRNFSTSTQIPTNNSTSEERDQFIYLPHRQIANLEGSTLECSSSQDNYITSTTYNKDLLKKKEENQYNTTVHLTPIPILPPREVLSTPVNSQPLMSSSEIEKKQLYTPVSEPTPSSTSKHPSINSAKEIGPQSRHICRICSKRFQRPSSLQIHYYTHTGEKIFECPYPNCGKKFSVKSNMTRHYKLH